MEGKVIDTSKGIMICGNRFKKKDYLHKEFGKKNGEH